MKRSRTKSSAIRRTRSDTAAACACDVRCRLLTWRIVLAGLHVRGGGILWPLLARHHRLRNQEGGTAYASASLRLASPRSVAWDSGLTAGGVRGQFGKNRGASAVNSNVGFDSELPVLSPSSHTRMCEQVADETRALLSCLDAEPEPVPAQSCKVIALRW